LKNHVTSLIIGKNTLIPEPIQVFHVVLYQPEIPPNSGNVIRLTANAGARLHLVKPLGFTLEDRQLARAGLDYHDLAEVRVHEDWSACLADLGENRLFLVSTRGTARYDIPRYRPGDAFVFGPETRGLPQEMLESVPPEQRIRLPMVAGNRSLNLSNAVAVMVFEAWRQNGFAGGS
jgi:tRNA (cytidine/uridine-2'-O-)-methyltransferase